LGRRELRPGPWTLDVIRELLRRLDHPQEAFPAIHVTGTRGKGSTCAMLERALREAGFRTGLTTSPHLLSPRERIRICGSDLAAARFWPLVERVRDAAEDLAAGYFEVLTAAAFVAFSEAKVDIAVVEVGLGGRVDATNVVRTRVGVVTRLGMDHAQRLGGTRASIAREKAGILHPGMRAVIAPNLPEVVEVVAEQAQRVGIPLRRVGTDAVLAAPPTSLDGAVQRENAAVALATLEELDTASEGRLRVPTELARRALLDVRWRARLELMPRALDGVDLLLDVAHDVDGTRALVDHLAERTPSAVVFACLADKDLEGITAILRAAPAFARAVTFVPQLAGHRSRPADEVAAVLVAAGLRARACAGVAEALRAARGLAGEGGPAEALVVAFGSFVLASEILRVLGEAVE
jgi:dihydrofolate synthase/folylpolyglutamate synthase